MSLPFHDRHHAGRQLSERVSECRSRDTIVLGLPRGGVQVAYEVAHALHARLDIFLLRHLIAHGEPDLTIGVVGSGGVRVLNEALVARAALSAAAVSEITQRERLALAARERTYRGQTAMPDLTGSTVILVDDGATSTRLLHEAVELLRLHEPRRIVVAVPVIAADAADRLAAVADGVAAVVAPTSCAEPERWHREFMPVSHTEVRALLSLAAAEAQSRELAGVGP